MADPFFYFGQDDADFGEDYLMSLGLILPPPAAALPMPGSAFEAYQRQRAPALLESPMGRGHQHSNSGAGSGANVNVHRRMFDYLRRIVHHDAAAAGTAVHPAPGNEEAATVPSSTPQAPRSSRFRHIMRERLRRERVSQGFADLHALLPPGASSKGSKNDIVGAAAGYIWELEGRKGWLRARNQELMLERAASSRWRGGGARNAGGGGGDDMVVKVRAESGDHATAVDVFEAVLRRLKAMEELRVTAIRSCFCAGGMWMDVGVESHQVSTREVDKAITNALMELSGNELGKQDPSSSKPRFSCQVESGVPMG
ncbi:uncharacterized protein [Setaria viridis]|uniref:BHLH domain-containing protein n=1 Tax=Setaria viridis TaxID=4556 RepID=A0A4U6UL07_SETVI|nr:transcription factor BHLH148-like [Setaria viridis]TKW17061.1 hypothetical protein SEVIR_5G341000v2 [Setaria viridis]